MDNERWKEFFIQCTNILGAGTFMIKNSPSLCSFTTFERLEDDAGYYVRGIPALEDVHEIGIRDGGVWGFPLYFTSIAHIILPRKFVWETGEGQDFQCGEREQPLDALSRKLHDKHINHRITNLILEMKFY